jgi:hypothetical protein
MATRAGLRWGAIYLSSVVTSCPHELEHWSPIYSSSWIQGMLHD